MKTSDITPSRKNTSLRRRSAGCDRGANLQTKLSMLATSSSLKEFGLNEKLASLPVGGDVEIVPIVVEMALPICIPVHRRIHNRL